MATLGMRGTGSFSAASRPQNWRQTIILLFPNASAPLTAVLSMLPEESTDDPKFNWFQKPLPPQRLTATASFTSGATSIAVTAGEGYYVKSGAVLYVEETGEIMWATADGASATVQVDRAQGTSAFASSTAADHLLIIGSSHPEGASAPTAITYDPDELYNYTQIFRNSLDLTRTAMNTRTRWSENGKSKEEFQRETLEIHSIEMERAFLWGARLEDTGGAHPERTTGGANYWITTNVTDFSGGVLTMDLWENFLEDVFENGSTEKLVLCGNRALNTLNKACRAHYTITSTPTGSTYGMKMTQWETPYGTLQFKQHPLLSNNAAFNDWGFVFDTKKIRYRYLQNSDTTWKENIQNPDVDGQKSEFLTECGFEVQQEKCHGIFKNATTFSA